MGHKVEPYYTLPNLAEDLDMVRAQLSAERWAAELLHPNNLENHTIEILPTRMPRKDRQNIFFSKTVNTPDTISAFVIFYENGEPGALLSELKGIFSTGSGLDGFRGILQHVFQNISRKAIPGGPYMTAYLNITFKGPVRSNATYLAVARVDKVDGRKFYVSQTIEDGQGQVLASAEGLFVRLKEAL